MSLTTAILNARKRRTLVWVIAALAGTPALVAIEPGPANKVRTPLGDYIPCMFTPQQRAEFKGKLFDLDAKAQTALKPLSAQLSSVAQEQIKNFSMVGKSPSEINLSLESIFAGSGRAPEAIVAVHKVAALAREAPDDISCSMSLLTWQETYDNYGRRIADQFVAFQVNVRNLNGDNEFLLHDVQIAVDPPQAASDSGQAGAPEPDDRNRFLSGHDKYLVRGVAAVGQIRDRRNFSVRLAEAIGSLAASTSLPAGKSFKDAANLFNGTAIPGFKTVVPDMTIDQMNRLNDSAFSARSNSRILVPKNDAVSFVTFVPVALTEEHSFLQSVLSVDREGPGHPALSSRGQKLLDQSTTKTLGLHKWPPQAFSFLQKNSYVVIAGIHVKEASKEEVLIGKVDCGQNGSGEIDPASASGQCAITGQNLQLVAKLVLKSATESTDSSRAEAKVAVSGDPSSASAQFSSADLKKLKGAYQIYWANKNGVEELANQAITVKSAASGTDKPADGSTGAAK